MSAAPVAAETIGATTGISQAPHALSGANSWRVNIRYGTTAAAASPVAVPAVQSTASISTGRPSSSAPAPTVSNAIGGAP
jgi:hypothetical protein